MRAALLAAYPWLGDDALGPRAVEAGECDRCGRHPRFVPTCGPVSAEAVCRDCALEVGLELWCEGHAGSGEAALSSLRTLPGEWDVVTRLWWIATGEVRIGTLVLARDDRLPPGVTGLLDG